MHTLAAKVRPSGKANALRRDGFVPGVVYGPSIESKAIAMSRSDLLSLFSKITRSSLISLSIDGADEVDVFLKVVEYDPITDQPVHVDFYHPDKGHPVKLHVPIKVVGDCPGVKSGGVLSVLENTLRVLGLPKDIPHLITIDVSEMGLGESIHIRDIDLGEVEAMLPEDSTVVSVSVPRGLLAAAADDAEEGEEGEGEEGAEPAAEEGASEGE